MQKISALIFSRNNIAELIALIEDIKEHVDQIVVIDSSSRDKFNFLKDQEKRYKKLNVYYFVALGYLEPARPYGLKKCKCDWVIHLDVDERMSDSLKTDIRDIVGSQQQKAYRIKRFEDRKDPNKSAISSFQIRLYNRKFVKFSGQNHELPEVKGEISELGKDYYLKHLEHNASRHYHLLEKLEEYNRITYGSLNLKFGANAKQILRIYEKIAAKREDQELSNFDYALFNITKEVLLPLVKGEASFKFTIKNYHQTAQKLKMIKKWKRSPNSKISLKISSIIAKEGIVEYLSLDKEDVVTAINRKYWNKEQGVNLLIKLLIDRYNSKYP